ncbi:rod shape-determining protein [Streptomyces sp. WAC04114]|uniref:rod shape-determining protein n=1 Tax=Streptomyces sp. WAC04114 TaxID=2867961 RepID=UPI001C8CD560|nr:rod shape-determining protein [Streptomyces sp. WAC04114]MBX9366907.1 rod shape-determining protein [Streptomyces sp. WAC04114]
MTDAHDPAGHVARHRPWPLCRSCCGIALDMGSARTRVWLAGKGTVVDVPTVTFPGTGAVHPVQRGTIIDTPGCSRMLQRLLGHRLPRFTRPMVIVTTPVLDGVAYRTRARAAVEVLRPRSVLTVPSARSIALAADADLSRPQLVVDIGAHLTEVVLLCDGAVTDAHRTAVGTSDLDETTTPEQLVEAVVAMLTAIRRQDRTSLSAGALRRGLLLAGGGALRPDITHPLTARLKAPVRIVPAPHSAAVRGAARFLQAAHTHPSASAALPPVARPH